MHNFHVTENLPSSPNGEDKRWGCNAKGLDLKATGAFIATPVAETLVAIVAWYYFKKGKWKGLKV
jgi:Na+-driven multidrug efflux pump